MAGLSTWLAQFVRLAMLVIAASLALAAPANAQNAATDNVRLQVIDQDGYGRLILDFFDRYELPEYKVSSENGVLIITFANPIRMQLPDVAVMLPDYVSVARIDPDQRGFRLGLKAAFRINTMEAGEKLFIDLLPPDWAGMLPSLPSAVVDELARRARDAALDAERERKAALVASGDAEVEMSVGRNPTFIRLEFDWSIDTSAEFNFEAPNGVLRFALPVPIDLFTLKADLPAEIVDVSNEVTLDGTNVIFTFAEGVEPRFYENSRRQYVIDVDLADGPQAVDILSLLPQADPVVDADALEDEEIAEIEDMSLPREAPIIRPEVTTIGSTVRVAFPFVVKTAAAVFRRGNTLWLFFDTSATVEQPPDMTALKSVSDSFDVVPANGTQVIRMNLSEERLATLASEGQSWVLSLGDLLLSAEQPLKFTRVQNESGAFSIEANLENPAAVHELRDPEVGDVLSVVTAFPPSRALVRSLDFVDFSALKTVHGMVIKPKHDDVSVAITGPSSVVISASKGLIVSAPQGANARDARAEAQVREGYVDLNPYVERDLGKLGTRLEEMQRRAADAERKLLDSARLDLARFYLANQMGYEALGVVDFAETELVNKQIEPELRLVRAAANVSAGRPEDALEDLNAEDMASEADALMWRTIARARNLDFSGARVDALSSEEVVSAYPDWVQSDYFMASVRAGLETGDTELAARMLGKIDTATLDKEELTRYELYSGRLDEEEGRFDEALDTYGQVIASDVRPTRAEAIYHTFKLLDRMDRLDEERAAEALASEVMVWRGGDLEADMMTLLPNSISGPSSSAVPSRRFTAWQRPIRRTKRSRGCSTRHARTSPICI